MYSLFIVDDEEKIRTGLKEILDWSELGYTVAGEASNGAQALKVMEIQGYPDVLLTDIRMPVMDGLMLLEEIQCRNKETQVVILSGYDQFNYVKRALEMKAFDYLLKPTKFTELLTKMNGLKEELDRKRIEKKLIGFGKAREQEQWLKQLLTTSQNPTERMPEGLAAEEICICMTIKIMREKQSQVNLEVIREKIDHLISRHLLAPSLIDEKNRIIIAIRMKGIEDKTVRNTMEAISCQMIDIVKLEGASAHIGIGQSVDEITALRNSFSQSLHALKVSFFDSRPIIFFHPSAREGSGSDESVLSLMEEIEKSWFKAVESGDAERATEFVETLFKLLSERTDIAPSRVIERCIGMVLYASRQLKLEKNAYGIPEGWDHLNRLRHWVIASTQTMSEVIRERQKPGKGRIVDRIEAIVANRYREPLQLQEIAESLMMNPDYLSRLFRDKTGESFVQYLMQYRIERAKQLLEDISCKCYEVGYLVGFQNPSYFSKTFKKCTGLSVSEYRERFAGKR
ncbi:response regulator [Paenibacillus sp. J5C_2022]|uniref:response regulator n=1 Tax=Paenibacillus sp. J5C2022 TaxID=2977129 RepID=UPI0021D369A7|nr:response regulator [Paenibacillus sp. J5C2022]MCU6708813.1 response regulator [Paenibacillus sp. J5C2022]